jgi:cystathionine beta-synthase
MVGADPEGSVLSGDTARPYLTEGIGEDFFPGTYDASVVDRWVRVSDRDAFDAARRITREEGILAGESCGTALVATLAVARDLIAAGNATDKLIVVLFSDGGRNYLSKLYNDEWLRQHGLMGTATSQLRVADVLRNGHRDKSLPQLVLTRTTDRVGAAIDMLQLYGISQLPVSEAPEGDAIESIVGSVSEKGLLDRAYRDPAVVQRTVGEVMDKPLPTIDAPASLDNAFAMLSNGAPAVVVVDDGRAAGVVTKLDLLEFLAHRPRNS